MTIEQALLYKNSLVIYRDILHDPVVSAYVDLLESVLDGDLIHFLNSYSTFLNALYTQGKNDLGEYVQGRILMDENCFSSAAANGKMQDWLYEAAKADMKYFEGFLDVSAHQIKQRAASSYGKNAAQLQLINSLPEWSVAKAQIDPEQMYISYSKNGMGLQSKYSTFTWVDGLVPVKHPDEITLDDFIGYEMQRNIVLENTKALMRGDAANNVLLYGDRGTGKSATVKAMIHTFAPDGLRLIQLPVGSIKDFHKIIQQTQRNLKYIIFIDDLSFDSHNSDYIAIKALLEGGVEARPKNIVVYATSNRRHLVREYHSERKNDEVHAADTIQENLSLSDRFGITVTYLSPTKQQFLEIVKGIAHRRGLRCDDARLEAEAIKWEITYNGRSPRSAKQFVDFMETVLARETEEKGM